mmetsp:Transcript_40159/g.105951  ORF Transcript_40159/g.105951 Transcript_40159/m.105951 type:complete len:163 (-) Transcript_40159:119-607(-)
MVFSSEVNRIAAKRPEGLGLEATTGRILALWPARKSGHGSLPAELHAILQLVKVAVRRVQLLAAAGVWPHGQRGAAKTQVAMELRDFVALIFGWTLTQQVASIRFVGIPGEGVHRGWSSLGRAERRLGSKMGSWTRDGGPLRRVPAMETLPGCNALGQGVGC